MTASSVATVPALHEILARENDLPGICVNVVIFASQNHEDTYRSVTQGWAFSTSKIFPGIFFPTAVSEKNVSRETL